MTGPTTTITEIQAAIDAEWLHQHDDAKVRHLLIDSRKVMPSDEVLFIAIQGKRHDGHAYLQQVRKSGIRNFVISNAKAAETLHDANVLLVDDTLKAFQQIAAWHRKQVHIPVLGITGSNGKTVVKEWLYQLLRSEIQITRSPRSYNSQVGVPLSVWMLRESDELGIIEAGISLPGEMKHLETIIQPTDGIFTNIGHAHSENFDGPAEKALEKSILFKNCKRLVFCADHDEIVTAVSVFADPKRKHFTWGHHADANLRILSHEPHGQGTQITAQYQGKTFEAYIPFTDQASLENALHCWAYLLMKDYPHAFIAAGLERLTPVAMRLELLEGINNTSIVSDVYSTDLDSLEIALDFLKQQKIHSRRSVVLSDISQSGMSDDKLYAEVADLLQRYEVNRMVGIGPAISQHSHLFPMERAFFKDTAAFLEHLPNFENETILLKGARRFSFEHISRQLQQQAHETVLEINLEALRHNLNYFRNQLHHKTRIMAMVKAFSYGAGSSEIASLLEFNRVDYLAVAYADEGVELRKAGITLPIMVMNPESSGYDVMLRYRLEPELYSFRVLKAFTTELERQAMAVPYPIHLKIDTGMHRLGFAPEECREVIEFIQSHHVLQVRSVFSHLVSSDDPVHDAFTNEQKNTFTTCANAFKAAFGDGVIAHLLNSAGISRFPEAQFDMVRLGIGLYGIGANPEEQAQLEQVGALRSVISQIKNIPAGETIGYGRRGKASNDMRVATLPIGYADGLNRKLSNGVGNVWIAGKAAPIIGNVCMDMCMVDVTNIACEEGDRVLVFGDDHPVNEMAEALGTIPYEILTSVSRRVKRVYYTE